MGSTFKTIYLADHPEYIEACAAWNYTCWGHKSAERTLQSMIERFEGFANKDKLPLTIVVLDAQKNVPIAMGSLEPHDSKYWAQQTPWVSSVFVHENYRGRGVARRIVEQLEQDAQRLGLSELYLTTSTVPDMYTKLGYGIQDQRDVDYSVFGVEYLFRKVIK